MNEPTANMKDTKARNHFVSSWFARGPCSSQISKYGAQWTVYGPLSVNGAMVASKVSPLSETI
jgi:hypothetical protein